MSDSVQSSSSSTSSSVTVHVNGQPVTVRAGTVVAAAIAMAGETQFRLSVLRQPRGPLCGMGICMECRATINGRPFCRTCLIPCEGNMKIETGRETALAFVNREAGSRA